MTAIFLSRLADSPAVVCAKRTSSFDTSPIVLCSAEVLYGQADGIDDADLIDLDDLEIWPFERCRVRLVGEAPALAYAGDGEHVVDAATKCFDGPLEGSPL